MGTSVTEAIQEEAEHRWGPSGPQQNKIVRMAWMAATSEHNCHLVFLSPVSKYKSNQLEEGAEMTAFSPQNQAT